MRRLPHRLAQMTYREAATLLERRVVGFLPVGAIEAHGPHLPLDTDVVIAETAATRAVIALRGEGRDAVVLPGVHHTVAGFALEFSGTFSASEKTASLVIKEAILGAQRMGFAAVVVVNAHFDPGNIRAIKAAVSAAEALGAAVSFPDVTRRRFAERLGAEFMSGACHAGSYETSLVLAADPFLVDNRIAEGLAPNPSSLSDAIREGKTTFREAGGEDAYFGYPADATASEGERLYAELADIFASAGRELLDPT